MTDELARLEREIAEESAISDIECNGVRGKDGWTEIHAEEYPQLLATSVLYLELRGLLERHPEMPELVRFVEAERRERE